MIGYPPPYEHLVWNYNHANQNAMPKHLIKLTGIFCSLTKMSITDKQVRNLNIFSNFIPNKLVTFNSKDSS